MSTQNIVDLDTVEGLRAALQRSNFLLAEAKGRLKRAVSDVQAETVAVQVSEEIIAGLERMIARAESVAMAEAVVDEESIPAEPIPAEPVPSFVPLSSSVAGPVQLDRKVHFSLSSEDGLRVEVNAYGSSWRGLVWSIFVFGRWEEVLAAGESCVHVDDWAGAVTRARSLFAKWSVPAAVVAIAA